MKSAFCGECRPGYQGESPSPGRGRYERRRLVIYINAFTIEPGPLRPQFTDVDTFAHQLQFFLPLSLHNSITTARMSHTG